MSNPVHDYLAEIGRKGGAAGRGPAKARSSEPGGKADGAMKKITLRLTGKGVWAATWSGPETRDIVSVMGSDTVETPFLRGYDSEKMRREIAKKNPGYVVEVAA